MLTDPPPRKNREGFLESDRMTTLDLPQHEDLPEIAKRLESAMKADSLPDVRTACAEFLTTARLLQGSKGRHPGACGKTVARPRELFN